MQRTRTYIVRTACVTYIFAIHLLLWYRAFEPLSRVLIYFFSFLSVFQTSHYVIVTADDPACTFFYVFLSRARSLKHDPVHGWGGPRAFPTSVRGVECFQSPNPLLSRTEDSVCTFSGPGGDGPRGRDPTAERRKRCDGTR